MTIDQATQILTLLNKKSNITPLVGTFVSATATGCIVDVGAGRIPAQFGTSYLPEVNESVWVWFINEVPYIMGSSTAKPGKGTVVSAASGLVTLSTAYGTVIVPYASTLTPTAGQVMKLSWQEGGFAHSVMSAVPVSPTAPLPPSIGVTSHLDTFTAIDAGSFGTSWWTSQVYSDDNDIGCWFYGSKIANTIPASAVITTVSVYVSIQTQYNLSPTNFCLHTYQSKPGGSPSVSSNTPLAVTSGWLALPLSFGNALKSGGGQFGVGVNHGGNTIFSSLAQDGMSGALQISSVY
jgi:hypothetical protein